MGIWCKDALTVATIKGIAAKGRWWCSVMCFHLLNWLMFLLSQWNSLCFGLGLLTCCHARKTGKTQQTTVSTKPLLVQNAGRVPRCVEMHAKHKSQQLCIAVLLLTRHMRLLWWCFPDKFIYRQTFIVFLLVSVIRMNTTLSLYVLFYTPITVQLSDLVLTVASYFKVLMCPVEA